MQVLSKITKQHRSGEPCFQCLIVTHVSHICVSSLMKEIYCPTLLNKMATVIEMCKEKKNMLIKTHIHLTGATKADWLTPVPTNCSVVTASGILAV